MQKKVVCCGNIAFDIIQTGQDAKGKMSFETRPGGSVFNTALQLSRLGLSVTMAAKISKDFLGDALLRIMSREKVCSKYIVQEETLKTRLAFAKIDKKGNSSYIFYKTEDEHIFLERQQINPSLFKGADAFHTGSEFSYDDFTFENAFKAMQEAKRKDVFITYDPNWREYRIKNKQKARSRIKKLLSYVDLLKLSETDALGITKSRTLSSALKHLPKNIIVTLGAKGSLFWDGKDKLFSPAFKVKIVDTIGAGDAFTAGLIYMYSQKGGTIFWEDMQQNLIFASAVSAIVCTGRGSQEALHNVRQVQRFINKKSRDSAYFLEYKNIDFKK